MNQLWQKFLIDRKITTRVLLMSSPLYIVALQVLPFCVGYPEEICRTLFDMLNHASTTQKIICSFELSLFSCFLALVYQLIVRSDYAFANAYYSCGPSSHPVPNDLEKQTPVPHPYLGLGQSSVFRRSSCNPASGLLYLEVLPSLYQEYHGNCTPSYEFLMQ